MTGIERLLDWVGTLRLSGLVWADEMADELESTVDLIKREHAEDCYKMGLDYGAVSRVTADMERHVSGAEGAEDSPVARWERELREALDGRDDEEDEAREAAEWVREHGGLDHVKAEWRSRVPYDLYERRRQRLLGHVAECETALGRRNQRIEELGKTIEFFQLNNSNFRHLLADVAERLGFTRYGDDYEPEDLLDALDRRLMPEGCEWPRYESGELVQIGDEFIDHEGLLRKVERIVLMGDGYLLVSKTGPYYFRRYGQRVKRPTILAADGEPLEVGQTVWDTNGDELVVGAIEDGGHTVTCRYADVGDSIPTHGMWSPSDLTHQRPVLDADGVPIKKGDTVYWLEHTVPFTVVSPHETRDNAGQELKCGHTVEVMRDGHKPHMYVHPESLHHTKPEPPDSWKRIEEDTDALVDAEINGEGSYNAANAYCNRRGLGEGTSFVLMVQDLVRRCRALAERERGE